MPPKVSRRAKHAKESADRDPVVADVLALAVRAEAGYPAAEQDAFEKAATKARKDFRLDPGNVALRRAASRLYRAVRAHRTTPGQRANPDAARAVVTIAPPLVRRTVDQLAPGDAFARNADGTRCGRVSRVGFGWVDVDLYGRSSIMGKEVMRVQTVMIARQSPVYVNAALPICTTNIPGPPRPDWIAEALNPEPGTSASKPRSRRV